MARTVKLTLLLSYLFIILLLSPIFAAGKVTTASGLESGLMFNLVKLPSLAWKAQTGFDIGYRFLISSGSIFQKDNTNQTFSAGLLLRADYFSFAPSALLADGNLYRGFHGYGLGLGAAMIYEPASLTIFNFPAALLADASIQIRVTEYTNTPLTGAQIGCTGSFGLRLSEVFKLGKRAFDVVVRLPYGYTVMAGASMISAGLSLGFELGKAASRDESAP